MTTNNTFVSRESFMKKFLVVSALALVLVLAFASVAVARPNGNIYKPWTVAIGTPHSGYTTTTTKCAVCHAVHYAATAGSTWTDPANTWTAGSENTEMLLRSSVANACNYCHVTTSIGGVQLYGGQVSIIGPVNTPFAHNYATCTECHAVHGANTYGGANVAKILRQNPNGNSIQAEVLTTTLPSTSTIVPLFADANAAYAGAVKYDQQVAFCSSCHKEYTTSSDATIQAFIYNDPNGDMYKGHAMTQSLTTTIGTNPLGNTLANGTQIAWTASNTCRQCHDAGLVNQTSGVLFNSFPHYTQGYYRFMTQGAFQGSTDASSDAATASDGLCLKCHKGSALTGVGQTF